jgi:hypothetical protein
MINWKSFVIIFLNLFFEIVPEYYFFYHHRSSIAKVFACLHEVVSLTIYLIKAIMIFLSRKNFNLLIEGLKEEWIKSMKLQ